MADESYTFTAARARLEEIVAQVRKKDVSLEKSLDLLEEGVRLANVCTELSDHTEWRSVVDEQGEPAEDDQEAAAATEQVEPVSEQEEPEPSEPVSEEEETESSEPNDAAEDAEPA